MTAASLRIVSFGLREMVWKIYPNILLTNRVGSLMVGKSFLWCVNWNDFQFHSHLNVVSRNFIVYSAEYAYPNRKLYQCDCIRSFIFKTSTSGPNFMMIEKSACSPNSEPDGVRLHFDQEVSLKLFAFLLRKNTSCARSIFPKCLIGTRLVAWWVYWKGNCVSREIATTVGICPARGPSRTIPSFGTAATPQGLGRLAS